MLLTGGLAVTTVALGGLFGGMALGRWNDVKTVAQKGCQDPENYKGCHPSVGDKEYEASSFATVSTFCFLAGSLAIAGTAILWITGPPQPPARSARIQLAPVIGPQGTGGALLRGTF